MKKHQSKKTVFLFFGIPFEVWQAGPVAKEIFIDLDYEPCLFAKFITLSKNKYFLILANNGNDVIIACLPTSKNHIPDSIKKKHGCISDDNRKISCYLFEKGRIISECGTFGFPKDTYIYGEHFFLK